MTRAATRVLVIRHGQSEWNLSGRWQGQADPPLTDLGLAQARSAARALGQVDAIWASDLQRAAQTAGILSEELGVGPVILDSGIRERDVGEWQGLTREEIDEQFPGYLPAPDSSTTGTTVRRPPGWEPDASVLGRASGTLLRIRQAVGPGDVVAVGHAGLIYALERELGGPGSRIANLDGRWFEVTDPTGNEDGDLRLGDIARLGERVTLLNPEESTMPRNL